MLQQSAELSDQLHTMRPSEACGELFVSVQAYISKSGRGDSAVKIQLKIRSVNVDGKIEKLSFRDFLRD